MQETQLGICNGMPKSLNAIAKLLRVRRIQFLGLIGTGVDDFDGRISLLLLRRPIHASPWSPKD